MTKKKVNGSGNGKERTPPVGERKAVKSRKKRAKKEKAAQKHALKYPFDTLDKGQSFTIPDADKATGKVTVLQNVKVLSYEFGKRHGLKFKIKRTDDGQVECTRIK